ncbi:MAG: hypothetical protein NXY57DRAFT_986585 [Lentinula lateritia]|nr:MAG: hypothetical protein NXY57DRAFT_986585 [Lentinula lateritia]
MSSCSLSKPIIFTAVCMLQCVSSFATQHISTTEKYPASQSWADPHRDLLESCSGLDKHSIIEMIPATWHTRINTCRTLHICSTRMYPVVPS